MCIRYYSFRITIVYILSTGIKKKNPGNKVQYNVRRNDNITFGVESDDAGDRFTYTSLRVGVYFLAETLFLDGTDGFIIRRDVSRDISKNTTIYAARGPLCCYLPVAMGYTAFSLRTGVMNVILINANKT